MKHYDKASATKIPSIPFNKKEEESWFPSEVIIHILSRLPAKSVQKFRCVCKSWSWIITQDRYLVARHLENRIRHPNSSNGLISLSCTRRQKFSLCWTRCRYFYHVRPSLNYSAGDDYSGPVKFDIAKALEEEEEERRYVSITNSCDGLVGIFDLRNFYIANPSIRKLASLTGESQHLERYYDSIPEAGIGLDASTGEYKAVRLFQYDSYQVRPGFTKPLAQQRTGCEVCTLGAGARWKLVDDAPFRPQKIEGHLGAFRLPVLVDGAIHWTVLRLADRGQKPEVALAFNLSDEKFDIILHPEGSSRPVLSRVVALAGRLCVADTPCSTLHMKIWVLKDYKKREWVRLYNINLAQMPRRERDLDRVTVPVTIRSDGIIVLFDGQGRRDYYDPQTGKFIMYEKMIFEEDRIGIGELPLPYNTGLERLVTYTDSLVWPWPTTV